MKGVRAVDGKLLSNLQWPNTNSLFEHSDLLEQTILVNKVYDETQINHSDREQCNQQGIQNKKAKQRSLLHSVDMMVVEH